MNYEDLIRNRKSTRDFKNDLVDDHKLESLIDWFKQSPRLVPDIELQAKLFINGQQVFEKLDGIAGYNGKMIQAPHYILIISENKEGYIENTGFMGESMILKAVKEGIDTCWVNFSNSKAVKDVLGIQTNKEITGIIAVGYGLDKKKILHTLDTGDNYSKADMQVIDDNTSFRYALEQIVFHKKWGESINYEQLEMRGLVDAFSYARLAPSVLNKQPWRFILDDSIVVLVIKEDDKVKQKDEKMDAGIVMLYFYLIISQVFDLKWVLGQPKEKYTIPEGYRIIGWAGL